MGNPDLDKQKGPGGWTLRQIRTLVRLDASRQTLDRRMRVEYSTERPHSSLGYLKPQQFAQAHG
jgi:transposase InsO family protein